jgi:hypothetical protein
MPTTGRPRPETTNRPTENERKNRNERCQNEASAQHHSVRLCSLLHVLSSCSLWRHVHALLCVVRPRSLFSVTSLPRLSRGRLLLEQWPWRETAAPGPRTPSTHATMGDKRGRRTTNNRGTSEAQDRAPSNVSDFAKKDQAGRGRQRVHSGTDASQIKPGAAAQRAPPRGGTFRSPVSLLSVTPRSDCARLARWSSMDVHRRDSNTRGWETRSRPGWTGSTERRGTPQQAAAASATRYDTDHNCVCSSLLSLLARSQCGCAPSPALRNDPRSRDVSSAIFVCVRWNSNERMMRTMIGGSRQHPAMPGRCSGASARYLWNCELARMLATRRFARMPTLR